MYVTDYATGVKKIVRKITVFPSKNLFNRDFVASYKQLIVT